MKKRKEQINFDIGSQCGFSGLQDWEGNFLQHAEILPQAANNHSYARPIDWAFYDHKK